MSKFSRPKSASELHHDWLDMVEVEGPFLSIPVLSRLWPDGIDRPDSNDANFRNLVDTHRIWLNSPVVNHEKWIRTVLQDGAKWGEFLKIGPQLPARFEISVPEHGTKFGHWGALFGPDSNPSVDQPIALVHSAQAEDLRAISLSGWSASAVDRMGLALRRLGIPIGLVTNGRYWAIVWAEGAYSTGSAIFDSLIWAEERYYRDAFFALIGMQRFVGVSEDESLPALLKASMLQQEEITDELGRQVRQAVELIVQSFSETRIVALAQGLEDPLPENEHEPYEAAVNVMMRIVFILFAEERGLLPASERLYASSYSISSLLPNLEVKARQNEELLDSSTEAWHRLLATSEALFHGASFEDMRMVAYGGSLFNPLKHPWLTSTNSRNELMIQVSDRVMMHVLRSIQYVNQGGFARRVSFREIDVEQIGYIYEGLLGYTSKYVLDSTMVGLTGPAGLEPELSLEALLKLKSNNADDSAFIDALISAVEISQSGAKLTGKSKLLAALGNNSNVGLNRSKLLAVMGHDEELVTRVLPLANLIRLDLRGLPFVVLRNGVVVTETRSRKNAGAHYTPKALAEEVVLFALEPLVYAPGPLQNEDRSKWKLKNSAEILNLKIADIAVGSGAFLVAAARYLSERLVEAWHREGVASTDLENSSSVISLEELAVAARREVIARCLYGADINEMAIEMCKLSLWLISLDPGKPFSFLDDKVMHGNSLLGLTAIDQLEYLHIAPSEALKKKQMFWNFDVKGPIEESARLRKEIASSPINEFESHRSSAHKLALLNQSKLITENLREIADGVVAAGLIHGGKPSVKLDQAYAAFSNAAFNAFDDFGTRDRESFDRIIDCGLTPTVPTDYEKWKPLHWILEVPDVMERGGFDAVIGNPPFLASKKLPDAISPEMRSWLTYVVTDKAGGSDLVGYFLMRAATLLVANGNLGLIAAMAIGEGETSESTLSKLVESDWSIYRSYKLRPWPAAGAWTNIAIVWLHKGDISVKAVADGKSVGSIDASLRDEGLALPRVNRLVRSKGVFKGSDLRGDSFQIDGKFAEKLLVADGKNLNVVRRYLNGSDVTGSVNRWSAKWCIDFRLMILSQAREYTEPFGYLETTAKNERQQLKGVKNAKLREFWWLHEAPREELYGMLQDLDFVIVLTNTSKHMTPAIVQSDFVFSSALSVWPTSDYAKFAVLSSWHHRSWAQWRSSGMRDYFRYSLEDGYHTFPLPARTRKLETLGKKLNTLQLEAAQLLNIDLAEIYRRVNDESNKDVKVGEIRKIHEEIDTEMNLAFGFKNKLGNYGFEMFSRSSTPQYIPKVDKTMELLNLVANENIRQAKDGVVEW